MTVARHNRLPPVMIQSGSYGEKLNFVPTSNPEPANLLTFLCPRSLIPSRQSLNHRRFMTYYSLHLLAQHLSCSAGVFGGGGCGNPTTVTKSLVPTHYGLVQIPQSLVLFLPHEADIDRGGCTIRIFFLLCDGHYFCIISCTEIYY